MSDKRYPILRAAMQRGEIDGKGLPDPSKREPRCGPWDEREDGSIVCPKCGEVDIPGGGPAGF